MEAGQGSSVLAQLWASRVLRTRAVLKIIPRLRRQAQGNAASRAASNGSYICLDLPLFFFAAFFLLCREGLASFQEPKPA